MFKKKKERKELKIKSRIIGALYLFCTICWLITGFINKKQGNSFTIDFVLALVFILLSVFYFRKSVTE